MLFRSHAGRLSPRSFADLKSVVNDCPHTCDTAAIAKDGRWLWQAASLYYRCSSGAEMFYFDRDKDDDWGTRENGFIEYRFTLKEPIRNASFMIRYAASKPNTLKLEINDEPVAEIVCPEPGKNSTTPPNWAYGFSLMKLDTVSVPLHIDIPAGVTSVRLIPVRPWKAGDGVRMQGFFLSSGPGRVSGKNYYALDLD